MNIITEKDCIVFSPETKYDYFIIGQLCNNVPHELTVLGDTDNLLTEKGQPDYKISTVKIPNNILIEYLINGSSKRTG